MIVQNITDDGRYASLTFTVPKEDQKKQLVSLRYQNKIQKNSCR